MKVQNHFRQFMLTLLFVTTNAISFETDGNDSNIYFDHCWPPEHCQQDFLTGGGDLDPNLPYNFSFPTIPDEPEPHFKKRDFSAPIVQNLKDYLELFCDCLIHIMNYKKIDLMPLTCTVVISNPEHSHTPVIDKSTRARWICEVHIYLLIPDRFAAPQLYSARKEFRALDTVHDFWIPRRFDGRVFSYKTRTIYQILISNSLDDVFFWFRGMQAQCTDLCIRNSPNEQLLYFEIKVSPTALNHSVTEANITQVHIVCWYCEEYHASLFPISAIFTDTSFRKTELDKQIALLNRISVTLTWTVRSNIEENRICLESESLGFAIRKMAVLSHWTDDMYLLHILSPNSTFVYNMFSDPRGFRPTPKDVEIGVNSTGRYVVPTVTFDSHETVALERDSDDFTFLGCGEQKIGAISFRGFVSAFDLSTWICAILACVGFWAFFSFFVEYFCPNCFSVPSLGILASDVFFLPVKIFLEQGDGIAANAKRRNALFFVCGSGILMGVVLTNAYKGENITKLTAPIAPVPYDNFSQIVEGGFAIFTNWIVIAHPEVQYGSEYAFAVNDLGWIVSEELKDYYESNIPNGYYDDNGPDKDSLFCTNRAIVGWKKKLTKTANEIIRSKPNADLFIGKETMFHKQIGFQISNWRDPLFLRRLEGLQESGIAKEIAFLRRYIQEKDEKKFSQWLDVHLKSGPEPLKMHGNIAGIFAVFGIGIVLAGFAVATESYNSISFNWKAMFVKSWTIVRSFDPAISLRFARGWWIYRWAAAEVNPEAL